jgi:hypothetical protein
LIFQEIHSRDPPLRRVPLPVRRDIADAAEACREPIGGAEVGHIDQVVDLPRAVSRPLRELTVRTRHWNDGATHELTSSLKNSGSRPGRAYCCCGECPCCIW